MTADFSKRLAKLTTAKAVAKIYEEIKKQQNEIDAEKAAMIPNVCRVIHSQIQIGKLLVTLKKTHKTSWKKQLDILKVHPRVARRLQTIGDTWWARENGLAESDLVHLPTDLCKLEWLCRLDEQQLQQVIKKLDCKNSDRNEVILAVKEAQGSKPKAIDQGDVVLRKLRSAVKKVISMVDAPPQDSCGESETAAIPADIADECRQLYKLLASNNAPPPQPDDAVGPAADPAPEGDLPDSSLEDGSEDSASRAGENEFSELCEPSLCS